MQYDQNDDKYNETDKIIQDVEAQKRAKENDEEKKRQETLRQMEINRENARLEQEEQKRHEQEQIEKLNALSQTLGIPLINQRIDELNTSQNEIIGKLSQVINILNQGIPQQAPNYESASGQIDPIQKMEALSGIFDKAVQLYSVYKQNKEPQGAPPLIDQNFINQRMVDSFMEDLDTGKSISTFIKNSLKKTATKNIVNTALKDIGHDDSNEPA